MLSRIVIFLGLMLIQLPLLAESALTESLSPIDLEYMQQQRDFIDETARLHMGTRLTGEKNNDLKLLQALLDRQLIALDNTRGLQAMGVVLGDILKNEESLNWIIYIDKYGRSRALAIPGQDEVVFPITMISRRAEVGNQVDVFEVYKKARAAVAEIRRIIVVR